MLFHSINPTTPDDLHYILTAGTSLRVYDTAKSRSLAGPSQNGDWDKDKGE